MTRTQCQVKQTQPHYRGTDVPAEQRVSLIHSALVTVAMERSTGGWGWAGTLREVRGLGERGLTFEMNLKRATREGLTETVVWQILGKSVPSRACGTMNVDDSCTKKGVLCPHRVTLGLTRKLKPRRPRSGEHVGGMDFAGWQEGTRKAG